MMEKKPARRKGVASGSRDSDPIVWIRQKGPDRFEIKTAPSLRSPVGIVPDEYKQFFDTFSRQIVDEIQQKTTMPDQEEGFSIIPAELTADLKQLNLSPGDWEALRKLYERGCICGFMAGVFMVHMPAYAAIRTALARGRKKGAAVVRKKAAPKKTAIRKRFRELRKSGFTKTDARKVLEQETGFSFRQIERDTQGLT
jgi:hypothetical protein